mmetsp:Transcript_39530/g.38007  ORF Transcript_39530/g.38007 Transcript_39530/m.38007 type:complete len:221 (+) Transcript_39530:853-1515(+)
MNFETDLSFRQVFQKKEQKVINLDPDASSNDESQYQSKVSIKAKTKGNEESAIERKKEKLFLTFKWRLLHDDFLRQELKNEMNEFAQVLMIKFQKADANPHSLMQESGQKTADVDAQKYHSFFQKMISHAHVHTNTANCEDTKLLVEFLAHFIELTSQEESYKGESIGAKTEIQEKLNTIGAVSMVLELMCSDQNQIIDELFPQLLLFANRILDGAQNNV